MTDTPARRGRPPVTDTADLDAAPSKRRRRASVGGHAVKLAAPARPGFTRRWVNDTDNRIANVGELAYEHVTAPGLKTDDPSSRIARTVGTKANGEPLNAYLMETPDELYAEGVAEKEALNAQVDEAIRQGRYSEGHGDENTYGRGSINVER